MSFTASKCYEKRTNNAIHLCCLGKTNIYFKLKNDMLFYEIQSWKFIRNKIKQKRSFYMENIKTELINNAIHKFLIHKH